jgi:hypothetical protein
VITTTTTVTTVKRIIPVSIMISTIRIAKFLWGDLLIVQPVASLRQRSCRIQNVVKWHGLNWLRLMPSCGQVLITRGLDNVFLRRYTDR